MKNTNFIEIELSLEDYLKVMNLDEFDIERKMLQTSASQYIRISLQPERPNPEASLIQLQKELIERSKLNVEIIKSQLGCDGQNTMET